MDLYVKLEGQDAPLCLEARADSTVADLRELLEQQLLAIGGGLGGASLILTFADTALDDPSAALADLGIGAEAVVHASLPTVRRAFDPELCCKQLSVHMDGQQLRKDLGYSWAGCTLQPPLVYGTRNSLHLRLISGKLDGFGAVGVMESSGGATDPEQITKVDNWGIGGVVQTYYWATGWSDMIGPSDSKCRARARAAQGCIITLDVDLRPGGRVQWSLDGTAAGELHLQEDLPQSFNFYVVLNNPNDRVQVLPEHEARAAIAAAGGRELEVPTPINSDSGSDGGSSNGSSSPGSGSSAQRRRVVQDAETSRCRCCIM
eukprot:TRINITY_DN71414_c0_g1_i1.p1 TRINITY_DN71414_c0_g1~~TRINITY_DN71414_c0_g1_i1.p1  ORF type:complete len:345 (+),score=72.49 TRINITY_DN71414_c0_g1_i1:83-1036(+)